MPGIEPRIIHTWVNKLPPAVRISPTAAFYSARQQCINLLNKQTISYNVKEPAEYSYVHILFQIVLTLHTFVRVMGFCLYSV